MDHDQDTAAPTRPRTALAGPDTAVAPLCLTPLQARLTESLGFPAGYLSGGALGYELAVSEALLTLSELAEAARRITARSGLPLIVDGGVGFGDPVHMLRTICEIEATGAAGIEIEDQVAPKRVSHHRGIKHLTRLRLRPTRRVLPRGECRDGRRPLLHSAARSRLDWSPQATVAV